jgi:HlyD family secretion protein
MWRALKWLLVPLALGGLYFVLKETVLAPKPVPVRVHSVVRGRVEETVTNSRAGSVKSRSDAQLSVEVAGRVVAIHHREGAEVEKDAPLLQLDDADARAALSLARSELETAHALLKEAEARFDHAQRELKRHTEVQPGVISEDLLDKARSQVETAQAQKDAAQARVGQQKAVVDRAEVQLSKVTLRASCSGVIAERRIEVGEWAVPGKPVLRLVDLRHLYVRAELDEVDLGRISTGLTARITLDPYRDRKFEGRVVRVAPHVSEVEAQNRTVEVDVEFSPSGEMGGLKPGISADVEVILQGRENTLRIPAYALLEGSKVLVAQDGMAVARSVTPGLRNWEFVEIREGLEQGAAVIVSLDREEVKAGARIRVTETDAHSTSTNRP